MFAVGVAAPSETNIHIYEDRRVALMFIDAHTASYCSKSSETAIRAQLHCAEQQHISLSEVAASQPSKINIRIASSGDDDGCKNTALAKAPNNAKIFGFDVSHHNSNIDWNKLVADGYYFVFIKATQGTNFADPNLKNIGRLLGKQGSFEAHITICQKTMQNLRRVFS